LLCASAGAAYTVVDGKVRVRQGRLTSFDLEPVLRRHRQLALELAGRSLR